MNTGCISVFRSIHLPIVNPPAPVSNITQPDCLTPTGSITITSPTGINFLYSFNNGPYESTSSFSGLIPNLYTLSAYDSSTHCYSTASTIAIYLQPVIA